MIIILGLVAAGIAGVTGARRTSRRGDQAKGNIKQAGEKVKDAFKK